MNAKITIENVTKSFAQGKAQDFYALQDVNLNIQEGEFVCLLGPSGCGKSTLLNLMAGFLQPSEGSLKIDGKAVDGPNPKYITMFQEQGLFPWRTVLGNVEFGLEMQGVDKKARREKALEYIRLVHLEGFEDRHPHELSGGMKQRAALAQALAADPEVIFMDEPFGALDAFTKVKMQQELKAIWKKTGKTIVLITHSIDEAVFLGTKIVVLQEQPGRIQSVIDVDLPEDRNRGSQAFGECRNQILKDFGL